MRVLPLLWGGLVASLAFAESVSLEQARTAVRNWGATDPALGCPLGVSVRSARTCSVANGVSCHVVNLVEGGFVVMSTDTRLEPVIAFSAGSDLVEDDRNPLWALLKRDLALRAGTMSAGGASLQSVAPAAPVRTEAEAKWAKLLSTGARMQGVSSVSDVRVAPLVQSKWDQTTCSSGKCYNYYTPNNYPCGCVATAGAQMMRYFQWPKATTSIASYTCSYCSVNDTQTALTTQGGSYDWSQMPLEPNRSGTTESNRRMIGKLTSDIGIICGMAYASAGSGTGGYMLQFVFPKFGYSNVITYFTPDKDVSSSIDMKNALLSNFDARLPVMISINGTSGGHAIVGDGYGYSDNTLYIHLNYGWSGSGSAWYAPPSLNAGGYSFNVLDGFVYNVYTNQPSGTVICSGRVLTVGGTPVAGVSVGASLYGKLQSTAVTDEKGIYALYVAANSRQYTQYTLTATFGTSTVTDSVSIKACTTMSLCSDKNADYGKYYTSSRPTVGNVWGKDLILSEPPSAVTSTTDVPVPFDWLNRHFPGEHSVADYETIANADPDGDGFSTWQEYVLDTDPNDPSSALIASIRMEGGSPVVEWSHTNAHIEALGYRYVPKGKASLASENWLDAAPSHRFFKVFVEPVGNRGGD